MRSPIMKERRSRAGGGPAALAAGNVHIWPEGGIQGRRKSRSPEWTAWRWISLVLSYDRTSVAAAPARTCRGRLENRGLGDVAFLTRDSGAWSESQPTPSACAPNGARGAIMIDIDGAGKPPPHYCTDGGDRDGEPIRLVGEVVLGTRRCE